MKDAPAQPEGRDYSLFRSEFQSPQLPAGAGFDAMLTNKPTGLGGTLARSSFSTAGALAGGAAGAVGGPLGVLAGSALGGFAGEITRQNAVQMAQLSKGEDVTRPGEAIARATSEGVSQGAGAGLGLVVGGALGSKFVKETVRPGINRVGAGVLKIAAGIPENVGQQVMENPSVLLGAPGRDAVSALYDAYHAKSGTMSRDEFISRSARPSDIGRVGAAIDEIDAAKLALRNGTLTEQQAVNASQASRIVSDARREGTEISQKMADYAQDTKASMDDFIARGRGPRTEIQSIPVAQTLDREATPIASKLTQKSDVYQSASKLVPEQVNVPTSGTADVAEDLRRVVDMVKRAKGNGLAPKSIMTDAERALYDQFQNAVEQSAQHNVPIETLLTKGEMTAPVSGFAERTVLREGEPIYAGANRFEFGGTVDKISYKPGSEIMGDFPVQVPALPGYSEYGAARDAARRNYLSEEMGTVLSQNKGNSTNVLRPWHAVTAGFGAGFAMGGPVGGVVGAGVGLAATSPFIYRTALQGAALVGKVPTAVYRVGTAATAGAAGSALSDAYLRQRPALP